MVVTTTVVVVGAIVEPWAAVAGAIVEPTAAVAGGIVDPWTGAIVDPKATVAGGIVDPVAVVQAPRWLIFRSCTSEWRYSHMACVNTQ